MSREAGLPGRCDAPGCSYSTQLRSCGSASRAPRRTLHPAPAAQRASGARARACTARQRAALQRAALRRIRAAAGRAGQADERSSLLQRLGLADASRSSSIEIEMTNFEQQPPAHGPLGAEYAGSRDGARPAAPAARDDARGWACDGGGRTAGACADLVLDQPLALMSGV